MRQIPFTVTLILLSLSAFSQCYQIFEQSYYPFPYTGGTSYELGDDTFSDTVDIGFPFCFFGETITKCLISPNGYISFNLSNAGENSEWHTSPIPMAFSPNAHFSAMVSWDEYTTENTGEIYSQLYGVPPYRKFVVSFDSLPLLNCNVGFNYYTEPIFSGQIVLYESLNVIDFNVDFKDECPLSPVYGVQGIINQTGTEGYALNERNHEAWTAQSDSYRYIPTCDCEVDSAGNFNIVSGKVFWDENGNCELDSNEIKLPHVRIEIQPGNGSVWTNQNGEFAVILEEGNYLLEHSQQNPWYLINECQPNGIPVTVIEDSNAVDLCFADSIVPVVDLSSTIASNAINACFNNSQYVAICNEGTVPVANVEVNVQIPSFTGTSNSSFSAVNDSTWSLTIPLLPAGDCRHYHFFGTADCDSSLIGQLACLSVELGNVQNDIDPSNNQMTFCDSVGVSYDPNDIRVLSQIQEEGWRTQEYIDDDDELTYMVRFQNTGTGPAFNVIVHNPLSDDLDHQSVELIAASHDYYAQMIDGELRLHFLGIELPDSASDPLGSQGYFIYKIQQPLGNPLGTLIENQAEIFFDFNAPVATNTTENEILLLTGIEDVEMGEINLYPNPTTGELFIANSSPRNAIRGVEVLDTQGRMLLKEAGSGISKIDMGQLSIGIYLIRIETEKGSLVKRVVRN